MIDRTRALNWWTGRISDADLAEWTGMEKRAVAIVIKLMTEHGWVSGGGKGSRHKRRISPLARNAVAIVHALNQAGFTFQVATEVISQSKDRVELVNRVVDWRRPQDQSVWLSDVDPDGGWHPDDVVPESIWDGMGYQAYNTSEIGKTTGSFLALRAREWAPDPETQTMTVDGRTWSVRTPDPVYIGEFDRLGLYSPDQTAPYNDNRIDEWLIVTNGTLLEHDYISGGTAPAEYLLECGTSVQGVDPPRVRVPFGLITEKSFVRIPFTDERIEGFLQHLKPFKNFPEFQTSINMTAAVRRMKRRALGLKVMEMVPEGAL